MTFKEIDPEKMEIKGERILIRRKRPETGEAFEKRESGLLIARTEDNKEPENIAEIVSVSDKVLGYDPGKWVIHEPFMGFKFSHGDYDYTVLPAINVLAVV